jgi:hypothetical protein
MTGKVAIVLALVGCGSGSAVVSPLYSPSGKYCGVRGWGNLTSDIAKQAAKQCCTDLGGTVKAWEAARVQGDGSVLSSITGLPPLILLKPICVY